MLSFDADLYIPVKIWNQEKVQFNNESSLSDEEEKVNPIQEQENVIRIGNIDPYIALVKEKISQRLLKITIEYFEEL